MAPSPADADTKPVKVLVSWAHKGTGWSSTQTSQWELQVLEFTRSLRDSGIDADLDLFYAHDSMADWTRFGQNAVEEADFVLVAMTEAWAERWSGKNAPNVGAGVAVEADALKGLFNQDQHKAQKKLKIVLLGDESAESIPRDMARFQRFTIDSDDPSTLVDLLRTITNQPYYVKPPLGRVPVLAEAARTPARTMPSTTPGSVAFGRTGGTNLIGFGQTDTNPRKSNTDGFDTDAVKDEYDVLSAELKMGVGDPRILLQRMQGLRRVLMAPVSERETVYRNLVITDTNAG